MSIPQNVNRTHPLLWFLAALVFFLSLGTGLFMFQQRSQLLAQVQEHADRELHLLGAVISHDLIKQDFVSVREYLATFIRQYPDISSIKVTAPNGFTLTEHRRSGDAREFFTRSYCVDIEPPSDKCVNIEIAHDLDHIHRHISTMTKQASVAMLFFAGCMGAILWAVLRRTAFVPLEQAVADLNTVKENLELRVAQRTADWMMANKELKQEILEREIAEKRLLIKDRAISSSVNGIALADLDGNLTYVNAAFLAMWGYADGDRVLGRSAVDYWASSEEAFTVMTAVKDTGQWIGEMLARRPDGSLFDVQLTAEIVRDDQGGPICLMGSFMDISVKKRTERMLLESESKFKSFAEQAIVGIYLIQDGKLKYCNPRFADIFGYDSPGVLADRDYRSLIHPDDVLLVAERLGMRLKSEIASSHYRFRGLRRNGETIHLEVFGSTVDYEGKRSAIGTILDITERVFAEEALQEGEAKYRLVLDNINEIIYMISLLGESILGDVVFVGGQVASIIGYDADAFLGDPRLWISLVHPDDLDGLRESTSRMIRERKRVTRVYRIHNRVTGKHVWLEDKVTPQFDDAGKVIGCFGVARDVTKRKQVEDDLRRTSDTLVVTNRLLNISMEEQSLDEVLGKALRIILSSPPYSQHPRGAILLLDEAQNQLRMRVHQGIHPEVRETCSVLKVGTCLCGRAAATREIQFSSTLDEHHETRHPGIAPHGHYCVPIVLPTKTLGVLSVYLSEGHQRDQREVEFLEAVARALGGIIERKRMEEERDRMISDLRTLLDTISASRREWQETFDSIRDMISIHSEDYRIIRANKAFAQNFGMDPRDVVNRKCFELFHHGQSPVMQCPHHRTIERQEPVSEEIHDPASGRIFHVSTFPYTSPESNIRGSIHIARDITELKEKEMRLIMSERLASLGQMASGVAHEINNPLAAIAGCVDGLNRRIARNEYDAELFRKYLGIIKDEINRTKSITTSMLSVVRKSSYEKKQVNIIDALEKALEIIGFQGRLKSVEVRKTYGDDLPVVYGSEGELKQVFLIVLTNALDAMKDRGIITLTTAYHDQRLFVDISDSGPGILPDLRTRIFDPFFTTKSEQGGTGLGLSIASRIMAAHNGGIEVLSDERPGATVRITLPLSLPGTAATRPV